MNHYKGYNMEYKISNTHLKKRDPAVTFPQKGERNLNGSKLPRSQRHRQLKPYYTMVGDLSKPWKCKLRKAV